MVFYCTEADTPHRRIDVYLRRRLSFYALFGDTLLAE